MRQCYAARSFLKECFIMQDTAEAGQAQNIFNRLATAAWQQLGTQALADMSLAHIAMLADVEPRLAVAVAGDVQQLILGKMAELDDIAILESFADIEDAGDISIREKILEALMHRFEIYAPYRAQIDALNRAACRRPDLALGLGLGLQAVTRRILAMAGDPCDGWQGLARSKGVVAVVLIVARVWMKDDSADLAPTMKELDRRLQQAEEWGVSMRVFGSAKPRRAAAGDTYYDDPQAGRYGVDND
jgi:hypothetical protein